MWPSYWRVRKRSGHVRYDREGVLPRVVFMFTAENLSMIASRRYCIQTKRISFLAVRGFLGWINARLRVLIHDSRFAIHYSRMRFGNCANERIRWIRIVYQSCRFARGVVFLMKSRGASHHESIDSCWSLYIELRRANNGPFAEWLTLWKMRVEQRMSVNLSEV